MGCYCKGIQWSIQKVFNTCKAFNTCQSLLLLGPWTSLTIVENQHQGRRTGWTYSNRTFAWIRHSNPWSPLTSVCGLGKPTSKNADSKGQTQQKQRTARLSSRTYTHAPCLYTCIFTPMCLERTSEFTYSFAVLRKTQYQARNYEGEWNKQRVSLFGGSRS